MASDIQDLKLGISQSELIQNTKTHIDVLYDQNSAQATDITNAQKKADDAYLLAAQKHKIVAYDTLSAMINELNSADVTDFNIGDEIYIKDTLYTRDFWVSAKQDTKYTTQTNENGFKADAFDKGYVGYFELSILDDRPEIINMVTSDENITEDKIVLGASDKKVKSSSYSIETTLNDSGSEVPTSSAVKNAIANFATKDELAKAGQVKDVQVNGKSVVEDGIANIDISNISVDVEQIKTDIKSATLVNYPSNSNIQYKAIEMPKTSVVIEVLKKVNNDDYLSVVTQSIVVGDYIYYLLDKTAEDDVYYYREVGGNSVGSGGSFDSDDDFEWTGNHTFKGSVDLTNANVIGLSVGEAGMSYKKITLSNMYSSENQTSTSAIKGTITIKMWLPDNEEITDFASLVTLVHKLSPIANAEKDGIPAFGMVDASVPISSVIVNSTNTPTGLILVFSKTNDFDTTNNSISHSNYKTVLAATVTVTTLLEGNVGGGASGENVLYQHHITFSTTTPIEIPSITNGTGDNTTYNRTATITNAQIVVLLDRNSVTNTDMIDLSATDKRSIHGFVTINISDYDYVSIFPIESIRRMKANQCYRITFVDYKILSPFAWVISELVTFDIPYDNITIGFDLVTPIITK